MALNLFIMHSRTSLTDRGLLFATESVGTWIQTAIAATSTWSPPQLGVEPAAVIALAQPALCSTAHPCRRSAQQPLLDALDWYRKHAIRLEMLQVK